MIIIFHLIAEISFADRALIGYIRVAVEAVAVLSWLAGFITMAVQIATDTCSTGISSCGLLKVATVYGAFEWLLFMITAAQTVIQRSCPELSQAKDFYDVLTHLTVASL